MGKQLEMEKIRQLEKLEKFADLQKEKALYSIGKESVSSAELNDQDLGDIEKELSGIDTDAAGDSDNLYRTNNFKSIDTSAHNVFPLKKVKSIKKITSMTELTQDQADRLRKAQEKRNE